MPPPTRGKKGRLYKRSYIWSLMIFVPDDSLYLAQVKHDELVFRVLWWELVMQTYQWEGWVHWSKDPHEKEFSIRGEATERGMLGWWTKDHYWGQNMIGGILLTLLLVLPFAPGLFAQDLERGVETRKELLCRWEVCPHLATSQRVRTMEDWSGSHTSQLTSHEPQHRPQGSSRSLVAMWRRHHSRFHLHTPQEQGCPSSSGGESQWPRDLGSEQGGVSAGVFSAQKSRQSQRPTAWLHAPTFPLGC